jgi:hypothetical protein
MGIYDEGKTAQLPCESLYQTAQKVAELHQVLKKTLMDKTYDYMRPKLSKAVCKKCYKVNNWVWDKPIETSWNYGRVVFCTAKKHPHDINGLRWIEKEPHLNCPYTLEHLVSTNVE